MKRSAILIVLFSVCLSAYAQKAKLSQASDHYKALSQFSGNPRSMYKWMDTIQFPSTEYGNSIIYLLVKPYYLSERQIKSISEGISFPANSSEQTRKELDYLLALQQKRTPEQTKRVEFLGNIGYWPSINAVPSHPSYQQNLEDIFFEGREIMGGSINAANFPAVLKVLQGSMHDMRIMEFTIKYKHLRPRPYHLEASLQPMARMSSPSYTSGHTMWAFLQAFIWSEIVPEKENAFIALAEEIRRSREIMGIHYPSDNESARQVAYEMFKTLFKNKQFNEDLARAKNEWKLNSEKYIK
jgi:acid phosphatase (class A)